MKLPTILSTLLTHTPLTHILHSRHPQTYPPFKPHLDPGAPFGNVTLLNWCREPFYLYSVGARPLNGPRPQNSTTGPGLSTPEDNTPIYLPPFHSYTEPFRLTCPKLYDSHGYCTPEDKVPGQGVTFKVARLNTSLSGQNISQFSYILARDPRLKPWERNYTRLSYHISMLDCPFGLRGMFDRTSTFDHHEVKLQACPGYRGGVGASTIPTVPYCRSIECSGTREDKCKSIYLWDPTWKSKSERICTEEFRGELVFEMCVNGDGIARREEEWRTEPTVAVPTCETAVADPHSSKCLVRRGGQEAKGRLR